MSPTSPDALALVRRTWALARADADLFEAQLGRALVRHEPALALLAAGAHPQAPVRHLVQALDVAVRHLERLHALAAAGGLRDAGAGHTSPGPALGPAFLEALEACVGAARLPRAARAAWAATWAALGAAADARHPPLPAQ